ncbi:MAG: hypothetical protein EHM36_00165 [Deltaproteobacteria bacterium]|nr:MAG: hypothetical protein EHM36_00165 [Deltaproteobacteria bacterium]
MKKTQSLMSAMVLLFSLFLTLDCLAQMKVKITDGTGKTVIENYLEGLIYTGADNTMLIQLRDRVSLPSGKQTIKVTIDGAEKEIEAIFVEMKTAASVSGAPIPDPLGRPAGTFPRMFAGPYPRDQPALSRFLLESVATDPEYKPWSDWLRAHPEDLAWIWGEYRKSNPDR